MSVYMVKIAFSGISRHTTLSTMHIGSLIRQQVSEKGLTVTWLAEQLPCSRTNVYKIFRKRSIDTDVLLRISRILDYDFFSLFSDSL